ncbi:monovalent cation/H(+) antiporter subunit G [Pseudogemmobacter faecipullorum]|uniref:Monovalent cation/H(+) antiporter subunit G n=1 Tax=Pseudogemmobacter faecipullorum TaxID=2755041 RepID=A0ABS8CI71_9RHOB|nr:monovalent cation/H(+) antiporter subunit G [Pseudogemmobacter faecipullorum]MCB5409073.1 monovalent cation/H(+) antiporter subunit G [Pseudogemmobacter faecipullorum]
MTEILTALFVLAGGFFALMAALGVLRFPDALSRMHAASKVGTMAGSLALIAAAIWFGETGISVKVVIAVVFLFFTAPIGAHLLGRAAARRDAGRDQG